MAASQDSYSNSDISIPKRRQRRPKLPANPYSLVAILQRVTPLKPWRFWIGTLFLVLCMCVVLASFSPLVKQVDQDLLKVLLGWRHSFFHTIFIPILFAISWLFKPIFTLFFAIICSGFLFFRYRHWQIAIYPFLTTAGAAVLGTIIKHLVRRDRPNSAWYLMSADGYSMPSGHTLELAALLAALIFLLPRLIYQPTNKFEKFIKSPYLHISTASIMLLLMFSRIYLANHFASDVLAGLFLGLACAWCSTLWFVIVAVIFTEKPHQKLSN